MTWRWGMLLMNLHVSWCRNWSIWICLFNFVRWFLLVIIEVCAINIIIIPLQSTVGRRSLPSHITEPGLLLFDTSHHRPSYVGHLLLQCFSVPRHTRPTYWHLNLLTFRAMTEDIRQIRILWAKSSVRE